jgi:hypothetical protein
MHASRSVTCSNSIQQKHKVKSKKLTKYQKKVISAQNLKRNTTTKKGYAVKKNYRFFFLILKQIITV